MARDLDLNIHVSADNKGLNDTAKSLDGVSDSADDAGSSFRVFGRETGHADEEIVRLKSHIKELADEFNRTGDSSLLKDISSDQRNLSKMQSVVKMLTPLGEEGGRAFNRGFLSSLGELGGNLRGALIPTAIGIGVLFAPIIGAAVGGAVVGAVGLGGIAGGIFAAAQDPAVKQAAHHFAEDIAFEFKGAGQSFVQPVLESLDILERGFQDMHLDDFFAKLAPHVTAVAEGFAGFFSGMMPGLNEMVDNLAPFIQVLATELPELGQAFGSMVASMSASEGSVEGLQFIFELLEMTMRGLGATVAWLGDKFHGMASFSANATAAIRDFAQDIPIIGDDLAKPFDQMNQQLEEILGTAPKLVGAWAPIPGRFRESASAADDFTSSTSSMTMSVADLTTALNDLFGIQMSLDQAYLAIKKDTFDLTAAVKAHGASISTNTEAGLINRDMVLKLIGDYEKQRQAAIKAGGGTAEATRKFDDQIDSLGTLLGKLGFTKKEIDTLLKSYKNLHDAPDIRKEISIHVGLTGQTGALSLIGNQGKIAAFDDGGWVAGPPGAPQMAIVHGGEYVLSREMLNGTSAVPAGRGGSGPTPGGRIEMVINTSGAAMDDFVGELVKRYVYFRGGDPIAALGS